MRRQRAIVRLLACVAVAVVLACSLNAADTAWEKVLDERFAASASLRDWVLEGAAAVTVTDAGRLEIRNRRETIQGEVTQGSVLWYRQPFWGDIRIEFTCQADPASRVILFFNARADNPHPRVVGPTWMQGDPQRVLRTGERRSIPEPMNLPAKKKKNAP